MTEHMVQISLRVPIDIERRISAEASKRQCGRSDFLRRIVTAAVTDAPVVRREAKMRAEPKDGTVLDLFERGHTINQIAAMTRLPYAVVATMIGRGVDARAAIR